MDRPPIDCDSASVVVACRDVPDDNVDPLSKIVARFAPELSSASDREFGKQNPPDESAEPGPATEALIRLFMAGEPLPKGWDTKVDPLVARWLGGNVSPAKLKKAFKRYQLLSSQLFDDARIQEVAKSGRAFDRAVAGHLGGQPNLAAKFRGMRDLPKFQPGKSFKDDGLALATYLASARQENKKPDDVAPAWHDYLASCSPATAKGREAPTWNNLLGITWVIHVMLGNGKAELVGRELKRTVTGAS
jgi:hypothetical protein